MDTLHWACSHLVAHLPSIPNLVVDLVGQLVAHLVAHLVAPLVARLVALCLWQCGEEVDICPLQIFVFALNLLQHLAQLSIVPHKAC